MKLTRTKKWTIIALIPLVIYLIAIFAYRSIGDVGSSINIPVKDIPRYGSDNQGSAGGWVYVDVVKIKKVGTTTYTSKYRNSVVDTINKPLYVAYDEHDNQLVLTPWAKDSDTIGNQYGRLDALTNVSMRIYGENEGRARNFFSGYEGIEGVLFGHLDDDVISYRTADQDWLSSEVSVFITDEVKVRNRQILDYISYGSFALFIILLVISRKVKKTEEIEAMQEKLNSTQSEQ